MDSEQLRCFTTDYAAKTINGQYYIGQSCGLDRTKMPPMEDVLSGDWIIRMEPILYGFVLGFNGQLEYIMQTSGQGCFASAEEISTWLSTPMDNDAPELTCHYVGQPGVLYMAKNSENQVTAFAFTQ